MQQSLSELTNDAAAKQAALGMDRAAFKLRNTSRGLEFQNGIEDFDNTWVHIYVRNYRRAITQAPKSGFLPRKGFLLHRFW